MVDNDVFEEEVLKKLHGESQELSLVETVRKIKDYSQS